MITISCKNLAIFLANSKIAIRLFPQVQVFFTSSSQAIQPPALQPCHETTQLQCHVVTKLTIALDLCSN